MIFFFFFSFLTLCAYILVTLFGRNIRVLVVKFTCLLTRVKVLTVVCFVQYKYFIDIECLIEKKRIGIYVLIIIMFIV